jgi:hypothetical protein
MRFSDAGLRLRSWIVVDPASRMDVRLSARRLRDRSGLATGIYLVVLDPEARSSRELVRAVIRSRVEILYIGKSDDSLIRRTGSLACGLSGGHVTHDFAMKMAKGLLGSFDVTHLRMLLIPYRPAYRLEGFLLREHVRVNGERPIGNDDMGGFTSARNGRSTFRPDWDNLLPDASILI